MKPDEFLKSFNELPLEEDLKVDKLNLDTHLEQQATLFEKYCKKLSEAALYKDDCKKELDFIIADLSKKIRTTPKLFNLDKVTETAINEICITTKEVIDLQNELMEWTSIDKYLSFVKESLNQKKDSLLKLVQLYSDGYYSVSTLTATAEKVTPKIALKRKEEVGNVIAKKLNRKKEETESE